MMKDIILILTFISTINSLAMDKAIKTPSIKSFTTFNSEVFNIQKDIKEIKLSKQYPYIENATLNNGQIIDVNEIREILINRPNLGGDGSGNDSLQALSAGDMRGLSDRLLGDGSGG